MRNSDSIRYECDSCGRVTKVNVRTGRLYSHQPPGKVLACPASGSVVLPPQGGEPLSLPPLRSRQAPAAPEQLRRAVDQRTSS